VWQIIARIGDLAEAFAKQDQLSRWTEKTGRDAPGAESQRKFLGSADDQRSHVFVGRETMMSENKLGQKFDRSTTLGDSDNLPLQLFNIFYSRRPAEIGLRLCVA